MTMPHNLSAERTIISNVLYEPSLFDRASALLPEQFYDPFHSLVWATILKARKDGGTCTAEYVEACLRGNDLFEQHRSYFIGMADGEIYFGPEVEMNATIVRDMATRRDMMRVAERMKALAAGEGEGYIDPAHLVADIEAGFAQIAKGCGTRDSWQGLNTASAGVVASVIASLKDGKPRGLLTGINRLDAFMGGMRAGDLVIIAGASSMGKTSFSRNVAYSVARAGRNVAFFSHEMTAEQLAARTLSSEARRLGYCRVPYRDMDNASISQEDVRSLEQASERVTESLLVDDTASLNVTEMRLRCRAAERKAGKLELIVVDYLQIMDIPQTKGDNRTVAIGRTTSALKAMAKEFDCPVIVLSQLSRAYFSREGKRPQLVDLRESGSIEQDADKVMFVHREAYFIERNEPAWSDVNAHNEWRAELRAVENRLEVIVAKNRMGRVGTVELWIDQACDLVLSDSSELHSGEVIPMRGAVE